MAFVLEQLPVLSSASLTFDDEFNTFVSSPDGSQGWMTTYPYGGESARTLPGNNEAEYYSDPSVGENPFSDKGGILTITATPAAPGSNPYNLPYDSGLITTFGNFSQLYGYFEVRAELPAGAGLWPAFWMLPADNVYSSELDVFEVLGNSPTTLYSTTHGSTGGVWSSDAQALTVPNTSSGFHTYGVDWEPNTITFYMDGKAIASAPTPASMNQPMYMLLDLAVGGPGSWPGEPTSASEFPASMKIDYVRAYATVNTQDVSGSAAISGAVPLGAPALILPPPVNIGSGSDHLVLHVSEDAWEGDAQYTVSVDGKQVGGTLTATASHAIGQEQTVTVSGNWGAGQHVVTVDFLNDAYGGTSYEDRNLYVDSASYDGVASNPGTLSLMGQGSQSLTVATDTPGPMGVLGSGANTLALAISEDAWNGNAEFSISVDGTQIGGVRTATANHGAGQDQIFDILGNWGPGTHVVSVDFLNDAYGGTAETDRNLYVDAVACNGTIVNPGSLALMSSGTQSLSFSSSPQPTNAVALSTPATTPASSTTYSLGNSGGSVASTGNDMIDTGTGPVDLTLSGPSASVTLGSGDTTISAVSGLDTIIGSSGALTFIEGNAAADVMLGAGAAIFDITQGHAGGTLSVADFVPGQDAIHLSGYQGSGIVSEQSGPVGLQMGLSDNTHILLAGISSTAGVFN